MTTAATTGRLSARLASRYVQTCAPRRGFRVSSREHAATNFTMPALSPTMTEGNIASWKVKEGDTYSAGDVLLEIETDKATMDVEAQDEGVMFKITQPDGSKGVKVGQRIAVTAEEGDDISSLELPAEDTNSSAGAPARTDRPSPQEEMAGGIDTTESSESAAEAPPSSKPNADAAAGGAADTASAAQRTQGGQARKQTYPLYPAVQHLLRQNGLSKEDADQIPASGPNGRLLKGDVLAYVGKISKGYPAESSARLTKLSHLDLSNIQLATPAPKPEAPAKSESKAAEPELPAEEEVAVSISLSAAIATQKRIQKSLGIFLPLSTFIARASELANEDLPANKSRKPTADDLFNSVLGLDKVSSSAQNGHFVPQVTTLSPTPPSTPIKASRKPDIIDLLGGKTRPTPSMARSVPSTVGVATGASIFSVAAKPGDANRATVYLERLKLALETEPGRLVL